MGHNGSPYDYVIHVALIVQLHTLLASNLLWQWTQTHFDWGVWLYQSVSIAWPFQ